MTRRACKRLLSSINGENLENVHFLVKAICLTIKCPFSFDLFSADRVLRQIMSMLRTHVWVETKFYSLVDEN